MRLYIWNNPFHVMYGGSILYAVAETEDQARDEAIKAHVSRYGTALEPDHINLNLGPPIRSYQVPCAEIYEWSE
jgi:hypothetical protein